MYFDELELGMSVETAPALIEKQKMLDFAYAYDNIPLHTDEEYAKTTPFGGLIAPGVMSFMCVWAKYLEQDFFGEALLAGQSTQIRWHKPVYPGDVLTGKVTITNLTRRSPQNGLVEMTIHIYNQQGQLVITNITEGVIKCKPSAD
jgi:acyl dehydratase